MRAAIDNFPKYRDALPIAHSFTRTLLYLDNAFEIVVMRWSPGSLTALHDHGGSQCWAVVLEGELQTVTYRRHSFPRGVYARFTQTGTTSLVAGDIDYIGGTLDLHEVRNAGSAPAFSVELYSPPLLSYHRFDKETGRCSKIQPSFDSAINLRTV